MEQRHEEGRAPPPFPTFMRPIPLLLTAPPCARHRYPPALRVTTAQLPDEVLLSIFERLSRVKDIAAVRSVCTSWRALVDTNSAIWRSIVFELPRCRSSARYAELWYRKAADYGNAQAQFLLALLYTYGYGRPSRPALPTHPVIV
ncbi:Cyclin-F [Gracilariopsis chorda]|uniref:Cyclin-F n=1 Tax=Gracilariopsis chorda TaxID=448386 RepID=A0A2V3J767_9FLOR|nr:Cyclin-F [Gracilariopsis chorda]|eukprot:PXF49952.1 Cyclin-F [Gracilariopsis chorda]